jgi:hypothetical protein
LPTPARRTHRPPTDHAQLDEKRAEHVDLWTPTLFRVDLKPRTFAPVLETPASMWTNARSQPVKEPGTSGLIGLPKHKAILETLRLFDRFSPQLLRNARSSSLSVSPGMDRRKRGPRNPFNAGRRASRLGSHRVRPALVLACCAPFLAACNGGGASTNSTVPVTPMGAILAVHFGTPNPTSVNQEHSDGFIAFRNDPAVSHGFTPFRFAVPRLNQACCPDVYALSEAWLQTPAGPVVVRAEAHSVTRPAFGDFEASAWSMRAQDATGAWSPVFAQGSANPGLSEIDDPETGGKAVPQLMTVGIANPQMFACAGGRSEDNAIRTTKLDEVKPPTPATGGGVVFIQDLLSGDDRFVPNAPGPLIGPATPPTPTITNRPGSPVTQGSVQCAMTQFEDDVTTRELHMLAIDNGRLYHSVASNFSATTTASGSTFERFNTVSPWVDAAQALGVNFGTIVAAAVTASRPTAISVLFVAQGTDGRYRLYHTVRFSNGSWLAADDVFALNGATLNGTNYQFNVAAGMCPIVGQPQDSELVYVIYDVGVVIEVGRITSTTQQWPGGIQGIYSPLSNISGLWSGITDPAHAFNIHNVVVSSRPFSQ